ncbi:MAG: hypothetical protein AMJ65_13890 [Phycisphaerae bacterium SG8_4]|nr:MAG: hypothetical protein AMJ65_13890 [Phycisphaerae bacterium SG8_4]
MNTFPFIALRHIRHANITVGKLHRIVARPICSSADLKSTEFLRGLASLGAIRRLSLSLPARSKKRKEESCWAQPLLRWFWRAKTQEDGAARATKVARHSQSISQLRLGCADSKDTGLFIEA